MRTAKVLERMDVQEVLGVPQEVEMEVPDSRAELAERAEKEFGYSVLKREIEQDRMKVINTRDQILAEREVLQILSEIGPDAIPFDPASVKKYQEDMVMRDKPLFYRLGLTNHKKLGMLSQIAAAAIVILLLATVIAATVNAFRSNWFWAFWTLAGGLISVIVLIVCGVSIFTSESYKEPGRWECKPLREYTDPVPEFVLGTALCVKEKLSEAEFQVEHFIAGKRKLDPFLTMTVGELHYYLEVWNEPDFKAKRLV